MKKKLKKLKCECGTAVKECGVNPETGEKRYHCKKCQDTKESHEVKLKW